MMKDSSVFLKHILKSINNINDFSKGMSETKFLKDRLRQSAIVREIKIIGEAVKNLPLSFRKKYPSVEWIKIAGMRDKLIHHYFGINLERVWNVIKRDLPVLEGDILRILEKEK